MSDDSHEAWIAQVVAPGADDRVPSLCGVKVGQTYVNIHSTLAERERVCVVEEIRLGGHDTYRGHEATVDLGGAMAWPLWSLAEHWDLIAEPGEQPQVIHVDADHIEAKDGQLTLDTRRDYRRLPHPCPYEMRPLHGRPDRHGLHRDPAVQSSVRWRPKGDPVEWYSSGITWSWFRESATLHAAGIQVARYVGTYTSGGSSFTGDELIEWLRDHIPEALPETMPRRSVAPRPRASKRASSGRKAKPTSTRKGASDGRTRST
jgi:hypothetical protein